MYQKQIERIIIHHTYSQDNPKKIDWDSIRQYHLNKGWNDIGYHYGIEKAEGVYKIVRGRPDYIIGAHCEGYNQNSLGIAVVGNFDVTEPPKKLYETLARLCCSKIKKFGDIPIEPHNKYSEKTCPGKKFDMDRLINLMNYLNLKTEN